MTSRKNQWSELQQELLFKLHIENGNRWSVIATQIPSKDDSSIKNKFYSTLRKGLRKLNKYIVSIKKKRDPLKFKGYKTIQELFITKIMAVVDHNYEEKYEVKQKAKQLALDLEKRVIQIAVNKKQYTKQQSDNYQMQEELLKDILQFNKNCKKRKGKRKVGDEKSAQTENDGESQSYFVQRQMEDQDQQQKKQDKEKVDLLKFQLQTKQNIILATDKNIQNQLDLRQSSFSFSPGSFQNKQFTSNLAKRCSNASTLMNSLNYQNPDQMMRVPQDNLNFQNNSTNLSLSGSCVFDFLSSQDLSKRIYPHAFPPDVNSSLYFPNHLKLGNISLEDPNDMSNSGNYSIQSKMEGKTMSLMDQIPQFTPSTSLLKSMDLQQSNDLHSKQSQKKQLSSSASFEPKTHKIIENLFPVFSYTTTSIVNNQSLAKEYSFAGENQFQLQRVRMNVEQFNCFSNNEK